MAVKGARTIAEYKILKTIQEEIPDMKDYTLVMEANEGTITDSVGTKMVLAYDEFSNTVKERGAVFE